MPRSTVIKRFAIFLRRLFGLRHPELTRRELAIQLDAFLIEGRRLRRELAGAVVRGDYNLARPLSAHGYTGVLQTRFPKMTEDEIRDQCVAIMQGTFNPIVIENPGASIAPPVLQLPHE